MNYHSILFYTFSLILLFAAVRVVTARNPVHSALYLVLTFFSAAALWILLKAELLALILVLVYVGAVMVLFLFVVMMLDINQAVIREGIKRHFGVGLIVGLLIAFQMTAVLIKGFWTAEAVLPKDLGTIGKTRELGKVLYTQYLYPFEIAAVILMVAIVAAVALTLRRRTDAIYTSAAKASSVTKEDRLRIVEMKSERKDFEQGSEQGSKQGSSSVEEKEEPYQGGGI